MSYENIKKAYKSILSLIKKHNNIINFDLENLEHISKCHLFGLELKHKYKLNVNEKDVKCFDYVKFTDYMHIAYYGNKFNRKISWEENNLQPKNELLLVISFSCGAYIFGNDYPTDLFDNFFQELKTYNPKYIDNVNHCLYYDMNNAYNIFNEFNKILIKYNELNKLDFNNRKIKKLEEEILKLKNSTTN